MMIQQLDLLHGDTPLSLSNAVNQALQEGWKLYGFPFVAACQTGATYLQAVTKEVEQPGAWG